MREQTQAEGETDDDDDKVPKEARKKEEKEKEASRQLERDLKQTEGRSRKIGSQLRELTRWIREQTSNVIRSVQAQNAKLTQKINDVPLTPGEPGPRGLPGVPGKNGMNGWGALPAIAWVSRGFVFAPTRLDLKRSFPHIHTHSHFHTHTRTHTNSHNHRSTSAITPLAERFSDLTTLLYKQILD